MSSLDKETLHALTKICLAAAALQRTAEQLTTALFGQWPQAPGPPPAQPSIVPFDPRPQPPPVDPFLLPGLFEIRRRELQEALAAYDSCLKQEAKPRTQETR